MAKLIISLDEAIKLISICSEIEDIYMFINSCDLAVNAIDERQVPLLIKIITTKLRGKALESIKYRDTSKWANIKKYLTDSFESEHKASSLQIELNSVRMRSNENANQYTNRVEKLFYKSCDVSTIGKQKNEVPTIRDTLKDLTLSAFIAGLIKPIKALLKARNPDTLELVKQIAKNEELEYKTDIRNDEQRQTI